MSSGFLAAGNYSHPAIVRQTRRRAPGDATRVSRGTVPPRALGRQRPSPCRAEAEQHGRQPAEHSDDREHHEGHVRAKLKPETLAASMSETPTFPEVTV